MIPRTTSHISSNAFPEKRPHRPPDALSVASSYPPRPRTARIYPRTMCMQSASASRRSAPLWSSRTTPWRLFASRFLELDLVPAYVRHLRRKKQLMCTSSATRASARGRLMSRSFRMVVVAGSADMAPVATMLFPRCSLLVAPRAAPPRLRAVGIVRS